jgi:tRNA pseudouridine32 synthase/23S rRNA pseudouridine746 synthase
MDFCFKPLTLDSAISLPSLFNYPFYYVPQPIAILATDLLMDFLENQAESFGWDFGLQKQESEQSRGRMFGVLVVKNEKNELGFLAAYSGNTTIIEKGYNFVPPVNDFWDENGFYINGIKEFDKISEEIKSRENNPEYISLTEILTREKKDFAVKCSEIETNLKESKINRDKLRDNAERNDADYLLKLSEQSKSEHIAFKKFKKQHKEKINQINNSIDLFIKEIEELKSKQKKLSNSLQESIYKGFQFLNKFGDKKDLKEIFQSTSLKQPPSGAGECAAPKLLQHAFLYGYQPIAMAEFWWGATSKDELRKHRHFYPACKGKCEPILSHMLKGIEVESAIFSKDSETEKYIDIVFEDDYLLIVNKPNGLLSVPGKISNDSVQSRLLNLYSNANIQPLIVHRLDMDTSGLLVAAKNPEIYKQLQALFAKRKVKKEYIAILDGLIEGSEGTIELKLSSDYLNRPRQIVNEKDGKASLTKWCVVKRGPINTLINFFPLTGRTHQLRVHAAHLNGLNCPVKGDDLYGKKADRLYLHAERIEFEHPVTKKNIAIYQKADFDI